MRKREWDQYAREYHEYIISPFQKNIKNPIFADLKKINTKNLTVADIGTGRGDLLPFLSKNFKQVHAIDFSDKMLEIAKEKNQEYKNIIFEKEDIKRLTKLDLKLDVAIAINSILHPHFEDVNKSIKQIYDSLNDNGIFIAIFPSMESSIYNFTLIYEREYKKYKDEKKALAVTKRIGDRKKYNFITSTYDEQGEKQKFFYGFDIKNKLRQAGFKSIQIKKVYLPWGDACGDYEDFPEMPEMWDWYVIANK